MINLLEDGTDVSISENNIIILDEMVGDCSIPTRNWESIISIYNADKNNKLFLIPSITCSKLIQEIKDGAIPKMIFREYGLNYTSFNNEFNRIKSLIEDILVSKVIADEDLQFLNTCKINPTFILGKDIERVTAFHFNTSLRSLGKISSKNPEHWKNYMKLVHPEEFIEKEEKTNVEVVIKIAPGLIDAI